MKIYAHRGFSSKYPENTVAAIKACRGLGIDGIEIDVQHSLDKKVVVIHDESLKRLCGVDKLVKDMTYDDLARLKILNSDERPLLLEDYVALIEDTDLITNVELKTSIFEYPGIEADVYEIFKDHKLLDRVLISSFNHHSLLRFHEIDPSIPRAALTATKLIDPWTYLSSYGFDYFHPLFTTVDEPTIKGLHDQGIQVNLWTVNDRHHFERAKELGVEGVITNYPDLKF